MHSCRINVFNEIIVARIASLNTYSATILCTEFGKSGTLDVTIVRYCNHYRVIGIHIFNREIAFIRLDISLTLVAKLVANFFEFANDYTLAFFRVGKNQVQFCNQFLKLVILFTEFILLQISELTQTHLHNGICLLVVKPESFAQALLCLVDICAGLYDANHLVDIIRCDNQSLNNMCTRLSLTQLETCATNHHIVTEFQEIINYFLQIQRFWTPIHQCNVVDTKRSLQLGHLEQLVQNNA